MLDSELSPDIDPSALRVGDFDVKNAVFIVPSDAPLPNELADTVTTGALLVRLAPLASEEHTQSVTIPLAGTELLALVQAWRSLARARRVYALFDLPGARYDVPFTQAIKQIGIRRVDWPEIMDSVARRTALLQVTKDTEPWRIQEQADRLPAPTDAPSERGTRKPFPAQRQRLSALPVPGDEDADPT